jgi:transcriptional regulator with XRE-family HTH domain
MDYNNTMTREELKAWRLSKGISQAKLADLLGVQVMAVSRWERGERGIPALLPLALKGLAKKMREKK